MNTEQTKLAVARRATCVAKERHAKRAIRNHKMTVSEMVRWAYHPSEPPEYDAAVPVNCDGSYPHGGMAIMVYGDGEPEMVSHFELRRKARRNIMVEHEAAFQRGADINELYRLWMAGCALIDGYDRDWLIEGE